MLCLAVSLCLLLNDQSDNQPIPALEVANNAQNNVEPHQPMQWFDVWQRSFTDSMDFTVSKFDGLFSDGSQSIEKAKAEGRIQLSWEPRTRDIAETDLRFRIRVSLPHLENRVDLLLSDNEDETQSDTIKAARSPSLGRQDNTTISLRFRPNINSHYSFRVGAGRRDHLYLKARHRNSLEINSH